MDSLEHPWQNGPTELIRHALEHIQSPSDFDQRVGFLLLDVGVETLFKTYLTLPVNVTGAKGKYEERKTAAEGNFHALVEGVRGAAEARLKDYNLDHVKFYHDLRNKLYHQGNGITIPSDKAKQYSHLAVGLLKELLGIDLADLLHKPDVEVERRTRLYTLRHQRDEHLQRLDTALVELHMDAASALELVAPKVALPSFTRAFNALIDEITFAYSYFPDDVNGTAVPFRRFSPSRKDLKKLNKRLMELLDRSIPDRVLLKMLAVPVEVSSGWSDDDEEDEVNTNKEMGIGEYLVNFGMLSVDYLRLMILEAAVFHKIGIWSDEVFMLRLLTGNPMEDSDKSEEEILTGYLSGVSDRFSKVKAIRNSIAEWIQNQTSQSQQSVAETGDS